MTLCLSRGASLITPGSAWKEKKKVVVTKSILRCQKISFPFRSNSNTTKRSDGYFFQRYFFKGKDSVKTQQVSPFDKKATPISKVDKNILITGKGSATMSPWRYNYDKRENGKVLSSVLFFIVGQQQVNRCISSICVITGR